MRILLSGGGTMGSVSPLLAIAEKIKEKEDVVNFLWLGTKKGPEKKIIEKNNIIFKSIYGGKFRRYFSFKNFIDPLLILIGFFQSFFILLKFKPDIILTAGSFVSVPVVWAGWFLNIPSIIHQQDIRKGLANKLMTPFAYRITVTFEKFLKEFPSHKVVWTGNPIREELKVKSEKLELEEIKKIFNLEKDLPTLLVMGGGTGALELNKLVVQALPKLLKFCQVIHLTGRNKNSKFQILDSELKNRYHSYEFLTEKMKYAYLVADLVVSRAGMGTLTELSVLAKPAIIIPIPNSHQEENANFFKKHQAAIMLSQINLTPEKLTEKIKKLLQNKEKLVSLSENIHKLIKADAAEIIIEEIFKIVKFR